MSLFYNMFWNFACKKITPVSSKNKFVFHLSNWQKHVILCWQNHGRNPMLFDLLLFQHLHFVIQSWYIRLSSEPVGKTATTCFDQRNHYLFKWSLSKEMWNFSSQDSILKTTTPLRITACVIDDNYKLQNTSGCTHDQSLSRWWHLCRLSPNGIFSIPGETGEFPFFQRCLQRWCKTKLSECTFWLWLRDVLNLVYSLLTWSWGKW